MNKNQMKIKLTGERINHRIFGDCFQCGNEIINVGHSLRIGNCLDSVLVQEIFNEGVIVSQSIPRKEFDISQHKFTGGVGFIGFDGTDVHMEEVDSNSFYTSREDAIAYAKHFKLTADDLK